MDHMPNQPFGDVDRSTLFLWATWTSLIPAFSVFTFTSVGGVCLSTLADHDSGTNRKKRSWTKLCSCLYGLHIVHSKKVTHDGSHAKPTFSWSQWWFPWGLPTLKSFALAFSFCIWCGIWCCIWCGIWSGPRCSLIIKDIKAWFWNK